MYRRPDRNLAARNIALIATLLLASGCVQATRHSNTMVFGTNTSLAVKVGTGVSQVPEISVGYSRQEAVIMPLLANTAASDGKRGLLIPCGQRTVSGNTITSTILDDQESPHPCKFVATKTDSSGVTSQDSYSVLASFGANIKARAPADDSPGGDIGVGLAQYFATGVAAQLLAANGGAAVVSVSAGATESAKSTNTGAATSAVTGNPVTLTAAGSGKSFDAAWGKLKIDITKAATSAERLQVINQAIGKAGLSSDPVVPKLLQTECSKGTSECQEQLDAALAAFNTRSFREN